MLDYDKVSDFQVYIQRYKDTQNIDSVHSSLFKVYGLSVLNLRMS
jgi:hypothetical protein